MAILTQPIRKGKYWTNILSEDTGESVNFEEVTTWWDGTPMDDSKCDGAIYRKLPASVGSGYVKRVAPSGVFEVSWFGAKGDGVTDDTEALKSALRWPRVALSANKEYLISSQITINAITETAIIGRGATIKTNSEITSVIHINSDSVLIDGLNIMGESLAQRGVSIVGNRVDIKSCVISNLLGRELSSSGISVTTTIDGGPVKITVDSCEISEISAPYDGTNGSGYGSSRGIFISMLANSAGEGAVITDNVIYNILGREGDGIHVITDLEDSTFSESKSVISGNRVSDCNRRHIKIQSGEVSCLNNITKDTFLESDTPNSNASIGIISSSKCIVSGNRVEAYNFPYGIAIEGDNSSLSDATYINNNVIYSGTATAGTWNKPSYQRAMFLQNCKNFHISENQINNNARVDLFNCEAGLVINNIIWGDNGVNSGVGISLNSQCNKVDIVGNKGISSTTVITNFIQTAGTMGVISDNELIYPPGTYSVANFQTGASGYHLFNNKSSSTTWNIFSGPAASAQYTLYNNIGGSGTGAAKKILHRPSPPTTGDFNIGDIVITPYSSNSRQVGYICTTASVSGDGGVWVPFGFTNVYQGNNSPEGILDRPLGSFYIQLNGTAGLVVYLKETPAGSTTGWTSITRQSGASPDTASVSDPDAQAVLDELRDLKTKMRAAGLLAT